MLLLAAPFLRASPVTSFTSQVKGLRERETCPEMFSDLLVLFDTSQLYISCCATSIAPHAVEILCPWIVCVPTSLCQS